MNITKPYLRSQAIFICILFTLHGNVWAQQFVRYYDSSWSKAAQDTAFFYTEMVKQDSNFNYTAYWVKSKKLNLKATYADTNFSKPSGLLMRYYENGQTEDSSYYTADGTERETWHYYNNGKLWVHYKNLINSDRDVTEAFTIDGKPIADFIYGEEANFKNGVSDWLDYISENVKTKVPVKNGAPLGSYQVIVRFIVSKTGKVEGILAETSHGYGMEEEVIRVIKRSPKWNPAIYMNEKINAYRRQPITFLVENE